MHVGLHVKYPFLLSDYNETLFCQQLFDKYSNINFHENSSSGSRVVSCGQPDGQIKKKLIVAFRNFTKAPNYCIIYELNINISIICLDDLSFDLFLL